MNSYKRLGKNVFLQTIGRFSSKILIFLLVPLYTSVLTTEEYGTADFINTIVTLLYPLLTLTIVEAEVRFALDENIDKKQVFTISSLVGLGAVVLCLIMIFLLSGIEIVREWYGCFFPLFVSWVIYEIQLHYSIAMDRFSTTARAGVINTFITILCTVFSLIVLKKGIIGYLLSSAIGNFVAGGYIFWKEHFYSYIIKPSKIKINVLKKMLIYSIPMVPNSISWWINNFADRYMIRIFQGSAQMGLLSVSYKVPSMLSTIIAIFISAWNVSAVENYGTEENRNFFIKIYKLFSFVIFISSGIIVTFTQEISWLLFRKDFYEAWVIVPILIFAYVFQGEATFFGSIFTTHKNTKILFYSTLAGSIVNIIVNLVLIPRYSGIGAAIATLLGYMVIWTIRFIESKKYIDLKVNMYVQGFSYGMLFLLIVCSYSSIWIRVPFCFAAIVITCFINRDILYFGLYFAKKILNKHGM